VILKAAAYCRYSSDNQREESIEAQARAIREYAQRQGYDIVKIYADEARSATTDNRPQFLNLMRDCQAGLYKAIIVHKLDRFSRDRYDSAYYKRQLKRSGVRLVSVLENLDDSPESIILESVLEGMAEYYSANLAREVMKGMKETAYQCRHTGGIPPLGYNVTPDKTYEVNEKEAITVRLIFEMYAMGKSYRDIVDHLNSNGHVSKLGAPFRGINGIHDLLRNEKYAGVFVFNKTAQKQNGVRNGHKKKPPEEVIRVEGGMPTIISKELWEEVQGKMDGRKHAKGATKAKETYLLSGIVFCGSCGASMVGNRKFAGRNKTLYASYECNGRKRLKNCDMKAVGKDYVEGIVIDYLMNSLFSEEGIEIVSQRLYEHTVKRSQEIPDDLKKFSRELAAIQKQIDNIVNAVAAGMFHQSMKDKMDNLEVEKHKLTIRIEEAKNQMKLNIMPTKDTIRAYFMRDMNLKEKSLEEQKRIIQTYVQKVIVFGGDNDSDNKMEIHSIVDFSGGGEGNRTPVRKHFTTSFSECSHCFSISSPAAPNDRLCLRPVPIYLRLGRDTPSAVPHLHDALVQAVGSLGRTSSYIKLLMRNYRLRLSLSSPVY